jgi:hypothetical protein
MDHQTAKLACIDAALKLGIRDDDERLLRVARAIYDWLFGPVSGGLNR